MSVTREQVEAERAQLDQELADPAVVGDPRRLGQKAKRKADLETHLGLFDEQASLRQKLSDAKSLAEGEGELAELARAEVTELEARLTAVESQLAERAHPPDPEDAKNAIIEIRAGAGGDEASLFAGDLYGMYQRYAEKHGLRVEVLSSSPSEAGGYKEMIFKVDGDGAYGLYRFEGGTHRVQRIPVTESGGRIHTSTATVAVLPEAEEVEFEIKPDELRVDVFRSSGPGGQSVNTTDSAVRITHLPTGLTVSCQDEKSQHKNKAKALSILRSRLKQQHDEQQAAQRGDTRRQQVGTGDRSEKIRTYNFPQDRVTDHRIKVTTHGVQKLLAGGLDDLVAKLREAAREQS